MSPNQQYHMSREDRKQAKDQLDWLNLKLARAEEEKHLITRLQNQIEIEKQGERALDKARQLLEEKNVQSRLRSDKSIVLTESSVPNKQSIYHLERFHEDLETNINHAEIHLGAAKELLKDKLTPTSFVKEANKQVVEGNHKIKDYLKFSQESKAFLSAQQNFLISGKQEEK